MMNKENLVEQDEKIQKLSISALNAMFEKASAIQIDSVVADSKEGYLVHDEMIQNMPLKNLKNLVEASFSSVSIDQKIAKTGLSENAIRQIESNRYRATLEEIIAYCKGLKIQFKDFVPEFFAK